MQRGSKIEWNEGDPEALSQPRGESLAHVLDDHVPNSFTMFPLTLNALEKAGEGEGKGEGEAISLA